MFRALRLSLLIALAAVPAGIAAARAPQSAQAPAPRTQTTFGALGRAATDTLIDRFYVGEGLWRECTAADCRVHNGDWGSDALTYALDYRSTTLGDARAGAMLGALARSARRFDPPCDGAGCSLWSDVPLWDAIANAREYAADPHDSEALAKARAAFAAVEDTGIFSGGACPSIRYQRPFGRGDHLKTLETDSNGVRAAIALYDATHERAYLDVAVRRYAAIRHYFLASDVPLYSVYVFDDGRTCVQVPHRFFASVNGNMIWNGVRLAELTGDDAYRTQALATAHAVETVLADGDGVFADLQAENDIAEPLVEAMYLLATQQRDADAKAWILANAAAAASARRTDGTFGRFFDGPPPPGDVSAWQTSGGFALEMAAAALAPDTSVEVHRWSDATSTMHEEHRLPATIALDGAGIALLGTIGDVCCQPGHARVLLDGVETASRVGVWQNKSSAGRRFPHSVLFAWRWPSAGHHVVTLLAADDNAKEGGPYEHLDGYLVP